MLHGENKALMILRQPRRHISIIFMALCGSSILRADALKITSRALTGFAQNRNTLISGPDYKSSITTCAYPRSGNNFDVIKSDKTGGGTVVDSIITEITSQQAADLVQFHYGAATTKRTHQSPVAAGNHKKNGLLIITSDASRGSNRHTGLASVMRHIGRIGATSKITTDEVTIVTRRVQSISSRNIAKSEINSILLGMKTAVKHVPVENRQNVLILTDSLSAISFFSVDENYHNYHYAQEFKIVRSLLFQQDQNNDQQGSNTNNHINTAALVNIAKVKSAHRETDGFFDHDLSDILSSYAKSVSNKNSIFRTGDDHLAVTSVEAPSLQGADLAYLRCSSPPPPRSDTKIRKITKPSLMKAGNVERVERCKLRIKEELGVSLPT